MCIRDSYHGVKKNEREELQQRLNLNPGNQITQNIVQRAKEIVSAYFKMFCGIYIFLLRVALVID